MITLEHIKKIYETEGVSTTAVQDANMTVNKGEMIAIMGTSGSGKTTLLNILGGLDHPTSGSYYFEKEEVSKMKNRELNQFRLHHIGFVFQHFELINRFTVYQNMELPLRAKNIPKKERKKLIEAVLKELDISELSKKLPIHISGGQKQRVAIGRAMLTENELILADEPTGALDHATGKMIMELFLEMKKQGRTIIIVTHDKNVASYADKIYEMSDGVLQEKKERII